MNNRLGWAWWWLTLAALISLAWACRYRHVGGFIWQNRWTGRVIEKPIETKSEFTDPVVNLTDADMQDSTPVTHK